MEKMTRVGGNGGPASKYEAIVERIKEIANPVDENGKIIENRKRPVEDVLDDFICDLKHINEEDYIKKVPELKKIANLKESTIKEILDYLKDKVKPRYMKARKKEEERMARKGKKAKRDERVEEMERKFQNLQNTIDTLVTGGSTEIDAINLILQDVKDKKYGFDAKERKYIIKKLQEMHEQVNQREKEAAEEQARQEKETAEEQARQEQKMAKEKARQEEIQKKVQEIWERKQEVARREVKKRNIKESQYWIAIRKKFVNQAEEIKNDDVRKQILQLIDSKIIEKEDDEYFEEVKLITRDFRELANYSAIIMNGIYGTSSAKMTSKNMDRFLNLRAELQRGNNEYFQIQRLLNNKFTTQGDRRVLLARKDIMDKEFAKKREESIK